MHDKHQCKNLLNSLSDYVDGELADSLCRELEQHLASCPDCRIVVDTTRKTISLYHAANGQPEQVPDDVRQRLFKCLNLEDYLKTTS
jgi:anti-sigma factor (TIGR02949 family)